MKQKSFLPTLSVLGLCVFILAACGKAPEGSSHHGTGAGAEPAAKSVVKKQEGVNQLSMRLNGVEWIADHNLFGAFHPAGYNKAILIAGSKGPKDKNEQAFNINLFNADGPGTYQIKSGNADLSVAQIANLSPENFMYGSIMGFDLTVKVLKASTADKVIEAQFEGTVTGNAGDTLKVTDGRFIYHE
ncbi:MAG: hypothetical protein RL693_1791 [Verrucomicrobiota bacterium]|jgi:hypothetical protein